MALALESRSTVGASSLAQVWDLSRMRRYRSDSGAPLAIDHGGVWMLMTTGSAALRVGDTCTLLEPGDAALITGGMSRSIVASAGAELAIGDLRSLVPVVGIPNPLIVRGFAERFPPVQQLVEMCPLTDSATEPLWSRAYANMIGAATLTAWMETTSATEQDAAVTAVLAAVAQAPGEQWTLERMARLAHLSRSALTIRFQAALGKSPSDVLRELRMNEARDLLMEPHRPIGTIAFAVGYGSTAAFSRAFSSHHGIPPQAWREGRRALSASGCAH